MIFPWESYGIPMAFPLDFHDASMIFLWDYYGVLKEFYGILKGFLCGSYATSMLSL